MTTGGLRIRTSREHTHSTPFQKIESQSELFCYYKPPLQAAHGSAFAIRSIYRKCTRLMSIAFPCSRPIHRRRDVTQCAPCVLLCPYPLRRPDAANSPIMQRRWYVRTLTRSLLWSSTARSFCECDLVLRRWASFLPQAGLAIFACLHAGAEVRLGVALGGPTSLLSARSRETERSCLLLLLLISCYPSSIIRQSIQQMNAHNHDQQSNRHNNQECKPKPAQHHRTSTDAALHAPVAEVLRYLRRCDGRRVLP